MHKLFYLKKSFCLACLGLLLACPLLAAELSSTIKAVKTSVVAVGTFQKTRSPAVSFNGTGFIVGDGLTVITNAHVVNRPINPDTPETLGILFGKGDSAEFRPAVIVAIDDEHDLARLKITGTPLPAMTLGDAGQVVEGQSIAFTGFPLGAALGFHHATHRGIVSAITPVTKPTQDTRSLDPKVIAQLRRAPYLVFQLDATAYPGNSGSPLYDPETGKVLGIINMVFVKGLKETAITNPSGITYAIPVNFIHDLLQRNVK
ncbi:serine protease [Undibacterium sp.]|jgi:serine protease Do|uniref:S1 family peptidase n=1 Tax=Undibacterium sp. TaxID=1914977 RepID=UPI002CBAE16D|nr:serine protease [Undibacterium sp.]HTD04326.1 serine protease [Undibacterium sp.]